MASKSTSSKQPSQEQIINGFNELRTQQRQFVGKMNEITDERKEYQLVVETLKGMEADRTCFRMIGGVLVQKTVGEVLPVLELSIEQMSLLVNTLEKQIEEKGKELVEYREKHNLRLQNDGPADKPAEKAVESKTSGVLVTS